MEKPWKKTWNLMLRCGNAGNGPNTPNTPGSTESFQGVHRTVPGCPWIHSGVSMEPFRVVHGNSRTFKRKTWKVSDYPKVSLESCPNTPGIFRGFSLRVPGKATAGQ